MVEDMAKNKANDARVVIVGSITGNSNTVGGGLVYPRADVAEFQVITIRRRRGGGGGGGA
jgi:hypothetical protein